MEADTEREEHGGGARGKGENMNRNPLCLTCNAQGVETVAVRVLCSPFW